MAVQKVPERSPSRCRRIQRVEKSPGALCQALPDGPDGLRQGEVGFGEPVPSPPATANRVAPLGIAVAREQRASQVVSLGWPGNESHHGLPHRRQGDPAIDRQKKNWTGNQIAVGCHRWQTEGDQTNSGASDDPGEDTDQHGGEQAVDRDPEASLPSGRSAPRSTTKKSSCGFSGYNGWCMNAINF